MEENIFSLSGKNFLITGASGGIGRQMAISINKQGGRVVITGRKKDKLEETYTLLDNKESSFILADLTSESDIINLVENCGTLDGIVHCAGKVEPFPTKYINEVKILEIFSINYFAPVLLMSKLFQKKKINLNASIVFISSFASQYPYPTGALYSGSKAAIESYSKVLAVEHADKGLRSNCIAPALVKTDVLDRTFHKDFHDEDNAKNEYEKFYLHGFGETTDVSNLAVFLLSNASRWITGQTIITDGGYMLGLLSRFTKT